MTVTTGLEWSGTVLGLLAMGLLARHHRYTGWGFLAFLLSSVSWCVYGFLTQAYGLLVMHAAFVVIGGLDSLRWHLLPPVPELKK